MSELETFQERSGEALESVRSVLGSLSDEVTLSWPVASYTFVHPTYGTITRFNSDRPKSWDKHQILHLGGLGRTDSNGLAVLRLNDFASIWEESGRTIDFLNPVTAVATPRSDAPNVLAVNTELSKDVGYGIEARVTVRSWGLNGAPAGEIAFFWHCQAPFQVRKA